MSIMSFRRINWTFIIKFFLFILILGRERPTGHMHSTLPTLNSSGWIILVLWFSIITFTLSQVYMRFFTISVAGNKDDALLTFYLLVFNFPIVFQHERQTILKEMGIPEHLTCLLRTYMQVRKQQLELDMEQQTGSK